MLWKHLSMHGATLRGCNRERWEEAQAVREEIRSILAAHDPLLPPLTAKLIARRLSGERMLSVRTVQWHMQEIRFSHCAHRNGFSGNVHP